MDIGERTQDAGTQDAGTQDGDDREPGAGGAAGLSLLQQVNRDGPLPGAAVYRLAAETAAELTGLHARGATHGRISPAAVRTGAGARLAPPSAGPDGTPGIPAYTAPEQLEGRTAGQAGDVFAWAATVAFAGTGQPPFGEGSAEDVLARLREPELDGLPAALRATVAACLVSDQELRPSAAEVARQLDASPPAQGAHHLGGGEDTPPATDPGAPAPGLGRRLLAPLQAVVSRPAVARRMPTAAIALMAVGVLTLAGSALYFMTTTAGGGPAAPPATASPALPGQDGSYEAAAYRWADGPAGSRIQVPRDAEPVGHGDDYAVWRDRSTGTTIQVSSTPWQTEDPAEHWRQWVASDPLGEGLSDLRPGEIWDRGEPHGWPTADYAFTFNRGSTSSVAYARAINTQDGQFMLFVSSPQDHWDEAEQHLEPVLTTFEP